MNYYYTLITNVTLVVSSQAACHTRVLPCCHTTDLIKIDYECNVNVLKYFDFREYRRKESDKFV
jgi:hypothetical protein